MAATWPITFQQNLNEAGFTLEVPNQFIETEMDVGPKKRRRRTTASLEKISCSIWIEKTDYTTLKNFYDVTLAGGTLPFEFEHPFTGVLTQFRMYNLSITPVGANELNVAMQWEEV